MSGRALFLLAWAGAACQGAPPPGGAPDATPWSDAAAPSDAPVAGCPLGASGRALVEELAGETAFELLLAVGSGSIERHVGHFLPGVEEPDGYALYTLDHQCAGPSSWITCESELDDGENPFLDTHDACVRVRCLSGGGAAMDAYWTMRPHSQPGDRHPFSYQTSSPPGVAAGEPNWLVAWRLDLEREGETRVSADLDRALVVTPEGEELLDLGHTGSAEAVESISGSLAGTLAIDFPRLAGDRGPIRLAAELGSDPHEPDFAAVTGTLSDTGGSIATFSGRLTMDDPPRLTWQGACQ